MSYKIIHASRARVEGEFLVLEVKSYSNNVRPWPTFAEQKRENFFQFKSLSVKNPEAIACYLERLAVSYDGGLWKERGKDISGETAYGLWSKRIRKVLPSLRLREPRRSKVLYDFCREARDSQRSVPSLPAGTVLTPSVASELVASGIYPRVRTTALWGEIGYLAFVNGGCCYVAEKPGARRGYFESSPVLVKAIEAREGRRELKSSFDAWLAIRLDAPGEAIRFMTQRGSKTAHTIATGATSDEVAFFSDSDAAELLRRLTTDFPEVTATIVSRDDVKLVLATAVLLDAEPVTAPAASA